jgi:hypothetical protein
MLPRVQVPENTKPKALGNWLKEIMEEEAPKPYDLDPTNENHCLIQCNILGT